MQRRTFLKKLFLIISSVSILKPLFTFGFKSKLVWKNKFRIYIPRHLVISGTEDTSFYIYFSDEEMDLNDYVKIGENGEYYGIRDFKM